MKKYILNIIIVIVVSVNGLAQQYPQYSHYMFNIAGYNPGFLGMNGLISANLISHDQWLGLDKSPATRLLTIDTPIPVFGESGVGLAIYSDNSGFEKNFSLKLGYSFHKSIGAGVLGIGIDAGLFNKNIDGEFEFPDQPESGLFSELKRKIVFDMGIGAVYKYENLFYVGLSVLNLNRAHLVYTSEGDFQMENHYIFTAGYNMQLANALIDLTPSILVKSDLHATPTYDINLLLQYNKKIWGGVTYRNNDALVFLAGLILKSNIKLGLAYDLTISSLQSVSNGTFEVYIGYSFDIIKQVNVRQYRSVRFL